MIHKSNVIYFREELHIRRKQHRDIPEASKAISCKLQKPRKRFFQSFGNAIENNLIYPLSFVFSSKKKKKEKNIKKRCLVNVFLLFFFLKIYKKNISET